MLNKIITSPKLLHISIKPLILMKILFYSIILKLFKNKTLMIIIIIKTVL